MPYFISVCILKILWQISQIIKLKPRLPPSQIHSHRDITLYHIHMGCLGYKEALNNGLWDVLIYSKHMQRRVYASVKDFIRIMHFHSDNFNKTILVFS